MSTILLVEDNADDAELALIGLKHVSDRYHIELATDGKQALEFLYAEGRYSHRSADDAPVLVLLDINLPNGNGLSILQRMRASKEYHNTPVLILTSSDDLIDIAQTRQFGANSYLQKSVDFGHFTSRLHQELDHWLTRAS